MLYGYLPNTMFTARPMRTAGTRGTHWLLAGAMLLCLPLAAQSPGSQSAIAGDPNVPAELDSAGGAGIDAQMEARRIAALNLQRQKQMVSDADKLLQLAKELNEDADAGGTKLSEAERLHKAAEIEKLAKNVKDKMIYAIGLPSESMVGPFAAWQR